MVRLFRRFLLALICMLPIMVLADASGTNHTRTIGEMFTGLAKYVTDIRNLMTIVTVLSGFSFVVASFFKFKQVKDNPTQIPIGTPFALLGVGVALIFLPSLIKPAAESLFGDDFKNNSEKCLIPGLSDSTACDQLKGKRPGRQ